VILRKILLVLLITIIGGVSAYYMYPHNEKISGAPPYGESEEEAKNSGLDPFTLYRNWKRPDGPPKVALQVGHWNSKDLPDELERIRGNTGASGGGKWEWEVNYDIAQRIAQLLQEEGVEVEILPATVPPKYWADVFIAIHADGSEDVTKSGYKFAGPWRDFTGKSDELVTILEKEYEKATNLEKDPNITRNMRGYYAFSWWRYEHAIHPMTTAVIAETGFLTSKSDQKLLIQNSHIPAKAIADGIFKFLEKEAILVYEKE
jgi:N-acetylmuramoyl-L-alanine amidase